MSAAPLRLLWLLLPGLLLSLSPSTVTSPMPPAEDVFYLFRLDPFATGFARVTNITHAGDERLFVTEKPGQILVVNPDGSVETKPFLDIGDRVRWAAGEYGLSGLAFHPDYAQNGTFFVSYTNFNDASVVSRFQVTADPNVADPASEEVLLVVPQPSVVHNVGELLFGPDGYLYVGVGDGGPFGDMHRHGQNRQTLYASILRLDVDGPPPYAIPPDNPFVGDPEALDEIWAYGLRNPWRFGFDPLTNDFYIADVGELSYEELNFLPAGTPAGQNFGWSCYEGTGTLNLDQCDPAGVYTAPIYTYAHNQGCAIIGGGVYRGAQFPLLQGHYLFIDHCAGKINALIQAAPGDWRLAYTSSTGLNYWSTFGTDMQGEKVLGRFGPDLYRLQMVPVSLPVKIYLPAMQLR